jgi:SOS-response transcriptional repressor LexA
MKPADLARALNIPSPTIHRLVKGKSTRPHASSLEPIANFFSITVEQLLGEETLPKLINNEEITLPVKSDITIVPIIAWEDIYNIKEAKTKSKNNVAVIGNSHDDYFALIMNDHSMEMLFPKRTILIFDPHKKPTDRSFVLVKLAGIETPIFRQLLVDVDHQYLKPLNPDLNMYKMRLVNENDCILASLFESRINHEIDDNGSILEVRS